MDSRTSLEPRKQPTPDGFEPSSDGYTSDEAFAAREAERQRERDALFARLNPRQRQAVELPGVSALVLAGAGSGKTSVLTARIAQLINTGTPSRGILAVTFTNKAAGEMRERLRKLLDKKTVNDLMVGTFHSLSNKILRENYAAAGLPKSFAILDTDGQEAICRGALKDLGLTKASVREAVKQREQDAAMNAGLLVTADPLVRAGGAASSEVDEDEVNEFVTPSQCAKYISSRKESGQAPNPPANITTRSTKEDQMEMVYSMYQERTAKSGLLDFQDLLSRAVDLLENDSVVRNSYRDRFNSILVDEFQDTNDIQYRWLELLKGEKTHVMAVGDDYQSIYAFRGANPKNMFRFLKEMATDVHAPEGRMVKLEQNYRSLPHILDAANSIIGKNTGQLEKTLFTSQPDKNERIDLITFSGGTAEAASIASRVHAFTKKQNVPPSEIAILYRTNQQSRLIEQELNKLGIPLTVYGGFRFYERQEIKVVLAYLDLVTDMTRDISFGRVVNFPPRSLGERSIEELRQQAKADGISMMEAVGKRSELLASNPNALGNAAAVKRQRTMEGFVSTILDLVDLASTEPLHKVIETLMQTSGLQAHYESEGAGNKASAQEMQERLDNIKELISAARQFEIDNPDLKTASEQLPEYMAYVALMTSTSESDMSKKNTVSLMTVHSSKGLEFDHVFIAGLEESVFPHSRAIKEDEERGNGMSIDEAFSQMGIDPGEAKHMDSESSMEDGDSMQEERRLMYVAVTRARKTLTLSHCLQRMINGEPKEFEPSRFLQEIPSKRLHLIDATNPLDTKRPSSFGNHEYGGDAFDEGRDGRYTKPVKPSIFGNKDNKTADARYPAAASRPAVAAGYISKIAATSVTSSNGVEQNTLPVVERIKDILKQAKRETRLAGKVEDPIAQDILASKSVNALLAQAAHGVITRIYGVLGTGASSVVLDTDAGALRLGVGSLAPPIPSENVIQPIKSGVVGGLRYELMPKADTSNITDADLEKLSKLLASEGFAFTDRGVDNVGRINGKLVVIDPGSVQQFNVTVDFGTKSTRTAPATSSTLARSPDQPATAPKPWDKPWLRHRRTSSVADVTPAIPKETLPCVAAGAPREDVLDKIKGFARKRGPTP
jgi:DNA helicase-2/ATP-dependent DNA helicase PcrA